MNYTFIGSGSCVPNTKRKASGGLLEVGDKLVLIDCGTGSLYSIPNAEYDYKEIDIICITHLHIDHINDFPALLFALRNDPTCNRTKDLTVIGPKGFKEYYQKIQNLYGKTIRIENFQINILEAEKSSFEMNRITIKTRSTYHTENSIGYRFEFEDIVFCASGDTGYHKNVIKLCEKADIAVLECSQPEDSVENTI